MRFHSLRKIYNETEILFQTKICRFLWPNYYIHMFSYNVQFFLLLRNAGRACGTVSVTCPVCRQLLSHCSDYAVVFSCGHGYHSACLGEPKSCYKCLNIKGWAPIVTNLAIPESPPPVSNTSFRYFTLHILFSIIFTEKKTASSAGIPTS